MTEKTKPQAANLQSKKRKGKIDKAFPLTGLERSAFKSAWNSLPAGVRKKCTAAELAQLVQIVSGMQTPEAQKPVNKSANRKKIVGTVLHRAKIALVSAPEALRREFSRRPALPPVRDYVPAIRSALTALAVRLPWGRK